MGRWVRRQTRLVCLQTFSLVQRLLEFRAQRHGSSSGPKLTPQTSLNFPATLTLEQDFHQGSHLSRSTHFQLTQRRKTVVTWSTHTLEARGVVPQAQHVVDEAVEDEKDDDADETTTNRRAA